MDLATFLVRWADRAIFLMTMCLLCRAISDRVVRYRWMATLDCICGAFWLIWIKFLPNPTVWDYAYPLAFLVLSLIFYLRKENFYYLVSYNCSINGEPTSIHSSIVEFKGVWPLTRVFQEEFDNGIYTFKNLIAHEIFAKDSDVKQVGPIEILNIQLI